MAYKPSQRRTNESEDVEPNLTPIMNLMVVLIPLLLSSAEFIKIGVIDLDLPPAAGAIQQANEQPQEKVKNLDLTVSVTGDGFFISSALELIRPGENKTPTIPKGSEGEYDFEALSQKLLEIKGAAEGNYPDVDALIIQAEPTVNYQTLVSTMDASRSYRVDGRQVLLFPSVSLSAGII